MRRQKQKLVSKKVRIAAHKLIEDPQFLFRVVQKIGEMGIVGEKANRLILFLAGLTKDLEHPVSVIEKGSSSSGKSAQLKAGVSLFPPESVLKRASLSGKAPAYSSTDPRGKILYIFEYSGARDASYLTRLLQSEGELIHEYSVGVGRNRGTGIAKRIGTPVILTTSTADTLFEDDETRFLTIRSDDSSSQTADVIASCLSPTPIERKEEDLPVWHEAIRLISRKIRKFRYPPWFGFLASQIPADEPRARRDVVRFLSLLKAVALCQSHFDGRSKKLRTEIEITFSDYFVAHRILNRAFSSTFAGVHPRVLTLAKAVRKVHEQIARSISLKELVKELGWEYPLVHKHLKRAEEQKLVRYESESRQFNEKRVLPGSISRPSFLPSPKFIFQKCAKVGEVVRYIDPLTGQKVRRKKSSGESEENGND